MKESTAIATAIAAVVKLKKQLNEVSKQEGPVGKTGPKGDKGVKGDQGLKGDIGPIGPQGAQGPTGAQGAAGVTAPAGAQGAQGNPGSGLTGPQGAQGANSVVVGPAGPQGLQGSGQVVPQGGGSGACERAEQSWINVRQRQRRCSELPRSSTVVQTSGWARSSILEEIPWVIPSIIRPLT